MKEYIIDGKNVNSLSDFIWEILECLAIMQNSGDRRSLEVIKADENKKKENLNQLVDYVYDLTIDGNPVVLKILNSDRVKAVMGYDVQIKRFEKGLKWSEKQAIEFPEYEANVKYDKKRLEEAKKHIGPTLFDEVMDIIRENKKIQLILE